MAHTDDRLHLRTRFGEKNTERQDAEIRQRIAFVGMKFFARSNQSMRTNNGAQFLNDASVHGLTFPGLAAAPQVTIQEKEKLAPSVREGQTTGRSGQSITVKTLRSMNDHFRKRENVGL